MLIYSIILEEPRTNEFMPGSNNAFLVKRKSGGGSQFSRDPLNLMNKHSRKVGYILQAPSLKD